MAASYPTSAKSFSTKATTNVVESSHINDIQDEVTAIETALLTGGVAHNVFPSGTRTLGTSSAFWDKGYVTALVLGAETTSGIRLEVNAGICDVREGDDSALAPLRALTLESTGAATVGGALAVTGNVTASAEVLFGAAAKQGRFNTGSVLNDGLASLATAGTNAAPALVFIEASDGACALFMLAGANTTTKEISENGAVFSVTAGTASSYNIYWSAGNARYELENKSGATRSFEVFYTQLA